MIDRDDLVDDGEPMLDNSRFLLTSENINDADLKSVDPETQARLEALLEAAGVTFISLNFIILQHLTSTLMLFY